ncbi:MAG: hypothetical protein IH987_09450 [Planctomycetes bacterium]|nr:hypothetical protein [Planctomycetota bacterium]
MFIVRLSSFACACDRRLNQRFRQLRSWHLFDTRFCNVAKGNEKGDVENLAKRSERTDLTPIPAVGALAELDPKLLEDCRKDLDLPGPRPHQAKTRRERFEEEKRCLLPQRGGSYIVGTPKAMLRRFEQYLTAKDWHAVQAGVEVKLVPGPDGEETFVLARSVDRRKKERRRAVLYADG